MIADQHRRAPQDLLGRPQSRLFHVLTQVDLRRDRVIQEIVRPYDLSVSQARALVYLGLRPEGAAMTELAEILVIDRTSLTRTMDKLVAAALVERREPAHDRRITQITLTPAGERVRETLMELLADHSARLLEGVTEEDIRRTGRVLATILERLVGHKAGAQRLIELL